MSLNVSSDGRLSANVIRTYNSERLSRLAFQISTARLDGYMPILVTMSPQTADLMKIDMGLPFLFSEKTTRILGLEVVVDDGVPDDIFLLSLDRWPTDQPSTSPTWVGWDWSRATASGT